MLMGMNFAFALAAGSLAVLLFRFSTNYVPMLLKATPLLLTVGLVIANWALSDPFYLRKSSYAGVDNLKGIELVCMLVLLAVSLLLLNLSRSLRAALAFFSLLFVVASFHGCRADPM